MPVDVTPGNVCIPYGEVKRRPYSTNSTAGLRFPTVPVDVAAADLSVDKVGRTPSTAATPGC